MISAASTYAPKNVFHVKDPLSALTHFIGFVAAILAMPVFLVYAATQGLGGVELASFGVFALSMVLLYGASTAYHTFQPETEKAALLLKRIDHMMIFILIAGSYTPVCVCFLPASVGTPMLIAVWVVATLGIAFKAFWVTCPKWVSSVIYICMGWLCVFALPAIFESLNPVAFGFLRAGGIAYTVGGVIYALKIDALRRIHPDFGPHELFHIFVMVGSLCHYITMVSQIALLG